jgi:hypothetical protein
MASYNLTGEGRHRESSVTVLSWDTAWKIKHKGKN